MALTKEILGVLENSEEPLCKRLKIADNAFKSVELPIQHREAILLKWLGKRTKGNEPEVWSLLLNWLTSQQMQDLSRNDISQEDVKNLMNVIIKRIKHCGNINTIISCASAIIENRNFQLFFKYDLETYCDFISKILYKVENEEQLYSFIKNEQLFNRNLISEEFYEYFIQNILPCLAYIAEKFCNNETIFQEIAKIVEKCLFHRNYKNFSGFLKLLIDETEDANETPSQLPELLMKRLQDLCSNDKVNLNYVYKLVFHSYCASYNNDFQIIYKFFIVILQTLGFDMASYYNSHKLKKYENSSARLNKSIMILRELFNVLIKNTVHINAELKEITFSDLIRNLTLTVLSLTKQPNENIYQFLNYVVILDPLIVEKILNEILVYITLSKKENTTAQYEKFLISLFEVFAKLHRIPNLISKMIPTMKMALEGKFEFTRSNLSISGNYEEEDKLATNLVVQDMIPNKVLNYFTQCITTLPSWQVMNLFKTFLFHLENAIEKDFTNADESKIAYIEIISILMCQFLCSVRIAEHTIPTVMVEKFVKSMEDLKEILSRFGSALVKMEHNPALMRTYLNICYSWGELYIILAYYSTNGEVNFQKTLDNDSSACNITYLHPYLSRDQWCLISQRIANFGEKPCKQIMHKLYIQKLKALLLFEENINEETIASIRTSILSVIDDNWKDIIFDQLVLDQIISKSNALIHIAEIVLQDVVKTDNYQQLNSFYDCKELISAMLYMSLYRLNKAFKRKQKRGQAQTRISLSSKIFPFITENLFLNQNEDLQPLIQTFLKEIKVETDSSSFNKEIIPVVNEKDLLDYMNVIKNIPIIQYDSTNIQQILIMHFICIYIDLQYSTLQNLDLTGTCESILLGLIQNCNASLKFLMAPFDTLQTIINQFSRHLEIFTLIIQNVLKYEDDMEFLKDAIQFLIKHLDQQKYLSCTIETLNAVTKHKKSKGSSKNLVVEYQEEICKSISEFIKNETNSDAHLIEPYTLVLKHGLSKSSDEDLLELLPFLEKYVEILNNKTVKGGVSLFTTIIRNKSKLKITNDDIVTKAWNYCQSYNADDKEEDEYSKLVMLVFEHIPNEQFSEIGNDLLECTANTIKNSNIQKFRGQLKIWSAILSCNFNPIKMKIWQKILGSLLLDKIMGYLKNNEDIYEDVVKFEIAIIQNVHLLLTSSLIEAILISISIITETGSSENFPRNFTVCVSLLENLLKFRKSVLMDYLPTYLQRYRSLLNKLCIKSSSDLKLDSHEIQQISDCAHKLEKLTKSLITCQRHLMRICPYLIADILKQYEEITLFPNVKIHLNNCLYSFISLCDQHAISYLMRILSTASTEMFKVIYDNYKKYYKFTGKV